MVLLHRIARRSVLALATLVVIASYAGNATPARAATLNWSPRTVMVPCKEKVGALPTAVVVSAAVAGLTSHTTYHFALVAANGGGQTTGPDPSFKTLTNPVLNLGSRARIVRQTALLQGRCVGSRGTVCSGRVTLSLRIRRRSVTIGSATFHLTAPAAATLRLRLTATAQPRVTAAAHHLLTVSALIISSSGRRTVRLVIGPRA